MSPPTPSTAPGFLSSCKDDFLASVVVFLVALPLCMGIAIASGFPPAAGIITGIVGGLVVGTLGGAPLQVSGPAAGLTVIVWELGRAHGPVVLGVIIILAGAMQVLAGILRLGQWFRAVAPAVILGMLAGIGVLIFASQFHVMIDDAPRGNGLQNLASIPEAVWKALPLPGDQDCHHLAAALGLLTIVTLLGWKALAPKTWQVVPAPLVAVAAATLTTATFGLKEMGVRCVVLPAVLTDAVRLPEWDVIQPALGWTIVAAAFSVALVASAETLLCAVAVDQMHNGPRTKFDRELAAQGLGNMICGFLGALPMTGVIVRSAANVEAGARSRRSAILHGLWLLGFVSLLPFVLEMIPTSSLAAILVFTGWKLINVKGIKALKAYGRGEVLIAVATVVVIVATSLLTGILVGVALSVAKLIYTFSHLKVRLEERPAENRTVLFLEGAATFIRLPKLAAALDSVPPNTELHVHMEELTYIDHACLDLLINWRKQHESTGGTLVVDWDSLTARFHRLGERGRNRRKKELGHQASPLPLRRAASGS